MKNLFLSLLATLLLLTGCTSATLSQKDLQALYSTANGPRYIVTLKIKQSHVSLDIGKHLKDSMNAVEIALPVDKQFYDLIKKGDSLNNDFRLGSLLTAGSVGSWDITVADKYILQ
ncbi:MAG: hypothetical protein ACRC1P_10710 [Cellulosilyticaceae bacterium]